MQSADDTDFDDIIDFDRFEFGQQLPLHFYEHGGAKDAVDKLEAKCRMNGS